MENLSTSVSEVVKSLGFESEKEFHAIVSSLNLTKPGAVEKFKTWQTTDCTKASLLKLKEELDKA
jgi:hypothetical protein